METTKVVSYTFYETPHTYMFNHYDDHFKFWNMDGVTFPNAKYVHPLKQRDIQHIYDQLIQDDNITLLVVFGNPVDFRFHSESDIDLYMGVK